MVYKGYGSLLTQHILKTSPVSWGDVRCTKYLSTNCITWVEVQNCFSIKTAPNLELFVQRDKYLLLVQTQNGLQNQFLWRFRILNDESTGVFAATESV